MSVPEKTFIHVVRSTHRKNRYLPVQTCSVLPFPTFPKDIVIDKSAMPAEEMKLLELPKNHEFFLSC
jgi:hypothetical protein